MSDETETNIERPVRDPATGHFLKGNKLGKGNPHAAEMSKFRSAVFRSVKDGDLEAITAKVIEKAAGGDIKAATLVYEILGVRVKQIEASVTTEEITPEEARKRVSEFFGIN